MVFEGLKTRIGNFQLLDVIGEGSFGLVKLGMDVASNERFAVKCVPRSPLALFECNVLRALHHPNIVELYETFEDEKMLYMVLELIDGGSLMSLVKNRRFLSEQDTRIIFQHICDAVFHCHQNGIIHRDLKLENILLTKEGIPKLIDFGLSISFGSSLSPGTNEFYGSLPYACPELFVGSGRDPGPAGDIWSLGVVLFCMLTGRFPFSGSNALERILRGNYVCPSFLSPAARDLIQRMLVVDPEQRATIDQVLQHPWFQAPSKL